MFDKIRSDFRAVFEMDPVATSRLEVIFTYAGFHAIVMHRFAHWLYRMGMPFFARVVSQTARFLTGIEIHPAAKVGGSFFIDHGMGVVIGETTEIGEHVTLFQGVTLGGTGKERGKRHPTIGNHVVVGTGAKVLGGITIGDRVKVGANAVVLKSVPPNSTVVGVPGRVVRMHGEKTAEAAMLDHLHMPDPLNETLVRMQKQIDRLEQKMGLQGQHPAEQKKERPERQEKQERHDRHERRDRQEKRRQHGKPPASAVPAPLHEESVQERQARMARMEKEERMKLLAFRRPREEKPAQEQAEGGQGGEPGKKRVRRRRRGRKGGGGQQTPPETAAGGGMEAGGGGHAHEEPRSAGPAQEHAHEAAPETAAEERPLANQQG